MEDEKKVKMVDTPEYTGPERRMVMEACLCHHKHTRILEDHEKRLDKMVEDAKKASVESSGKHSDIYDEMRVIDRAKVSNRLFYLFISVYSLLFIFGIISVYQGMHKNAITFTQGIADVKIMQTETDAKVANLTGDVNELKTDVKEYIRQANGEHN